MSKTPVIIKIDEKMNLINQLEGEAIEAHGNGLAWAKFWPTIAQRVNQAEPTSAERRRNLVDRLLHLLINGDAAGFEPPPIGDPWETGDELRTRDDVTTQAHLLFALQPVFSPEHRT